MTGQNPCISNFLGNIALMEEGEQRLGRRCGEGSGFGAAGATNSSGLDRKAASSASPAIL